MIRLNMIVEGQTEETFVNKILRPHLAAQNIFTYVRCVETGRKRDRIYRGGMTTYSKAKKDIELWMKQDHGEDVRFTTMFDFYRLPIDFPGFDAAKIKTDAYDKVSLIEKQLSDDIGSPRFIPYIQLHEFEALLLAAPEKFKHYYIDDAHALRLLINEIAEFSNPELINERPETAPSKRIIKHLTRYANEKPVAGPQIAEHIGLSLIRSKCSHFETWITRLENLNTSS